jgi:magnesium-transporting ATPase (P-type)
MIQNLGKIDIVLTSMTGTLTENQTSLKEIYYDGKIHSLEG